MSPLRKFILRLVIYGAALAYLAGDLFVFEGPLRRRMNLADPFTPEAIAKAKAEGVVARVFNHRITRSQLERALRERLWLEGKSIGSMPPEQLRTLRYAALDELIDHELLRVKAKAHALDLRLSEAEIDRRLGQFAAAFASPEEMEQVLRREGIGGTADLRDRLAARIQQEKYVDSRISPVAGLGEDEAKEWFEENRARLANPERVRARHIFLSAGARDPEQAAATLEAALAAILAGEKDFAALAAELSEDPATRDTGGDLGWAGRDRLPAELAEALFAIDPGRPAILRSRLGWHLAEVTAREPAANRDFAAAAAEVTAALSSHRRDQAAAEFRNALRRFEAAKIQVFHDMIE